MRSRRGHHCGGSSGGGNELNHAAAVRVGTL
jgi:hypothetical protein